MTVTFTEPVDTDPTIETRNIAHGVNNRANTRTIDRLGIPPRRMTFNRKPFQTNNPVELVKHSIELVDLFPFVDFESFQVTNDQKITLDRQVSP